MNSEEASNAIEQNTDRNDDGWLKRSWNPFRIALLRGLGVVLPPLLTIIFFFWVWNTVDRAVIKPAQSVATNVLVWAMDSSIPNSEVTSAIAKNTGQLTKVGENEVYIKPDGNAYQKIGTSWVPSGVAAYVAEHPPEEPVVDSYTAYAHYVNQRFLKQRLMIPAVLALFVVFLYLTGKLLAAGIGRILWGFMESLINRLPIIRNVYSSVKQVTDFAFKDTDVQFSRVVAVEYPRKGIWSMGFVTGESMMDIRIAAGEPMLSVLMPTSPMPATGFTVSVPKSETIDLNLTVDQAIQFCVSCGVVVPPEQLTRPTIDGQAKLLNGQNPVGSDSQPATNVAAPSGNGSTDSPSHGSDSTESNPSQLDSATGDEAE